MSALENNVWIIIPSLNEAPVIRKTIEGIIPYGYNIVVVDDGSNDGTCEKVIDLPICILSHSVNLGQGAALQTGIEYALKQGADFLITFDSDGQHNPEDIKKFLNPLRHEHYDVVLGSRFINRENFETIPKLKKKVLQLATWFTRITTRLNVTDTHNGFRAFSRKAAMNIKIMQNRMAHASEILHIIAQKKMRYKEIPTSILYTDYSTKKGQKVSNAINILWDILFKRR